MWRGLMRPASPPKHACARSSASPASRAVVSAKANSLSAPLASFCGGASPLHLACGSGAEAAARALLAAGADPVRTGYRTLIAEDII